MQRIEWTDDKLDYMAEIIPGHTESEIRELFRKRYGVTLTEGQIGNTKAKLGIKSGTTGGRFVKGHVPANKGKTWDEMGMSDEARKNMLSTCFKPGNEPTNGQRCKVGDERISKDGYIEVKVKRFSGRPGSNKCWRMKHHLVWEETHQRPVPPSTMIVFADHDRLNFNPDNIVAVPRSLWAIISRHKIPYYDRESLQTAVQIAELKQMVRKAECRPRTCRKCGNEFEARYPHQRTCDECLGRKPTNN